MPSRFGQQDPNLSRHRLSIDRTHSSIATFRLWSSSINFTSKLAVALFTRISRTSLGLSSTSRLPLLEAMTIPISTNASARALNS